MPKSKSKPAKRATKKPRGQKDIRTALKPKKNELVAYSEDFNAVCKQSRLDVDAEQLQLAIALSKSLQSAEQNIVTSPEEPQPSTSKERVGEIRKTLQEYGFKVPHVKINTVGTKRRRRKRTKDSILLLTTDAERRQRITDRYTQVLFENVSQTNNIESVNISSEDTLYHLATNVSYEILRDSQVFYVKGLLKSITSTIGSLLKDWSQIPGRPLSPVKKIRKVNFDKMNLSLAEVDTILSGSIAQAQEIVESKKVEEDVEVELIHKEMNETSEATRKSGQYDNLLQTQSRSYSPDLFDDEVISIENSEEAVSTQKSTSQHSCSQRNSQKSIPNVTQSKTNDFMDLTECGNDFPVLHVAKNNTVTADKIGTENSQRSDDLMEITECVTKTQTAITKNHGHQLYSDKSNDSIEVTELIQIKDSNKEDNIDLTQESENEREIVLGVVSKTKNDVATDYENIDLTQSDHSDDDTLPIVHISGQMTRSLNEEINVLSPGKELCRNNRLSQAEIICEVNSINGDDEIELDNTKVDSPIKDDRIVEERNTSSSKQSSTFEEFVFEHSDHQSSKDVKTKLTDNSAGVDSAEQEIEIDLTQNTDSSHDSIEPESLPVNIPADCLGKIDDVYIDYDEVYMDKTIENINSDQLRNESVQSDKYENYSNNADDVSSDDNDVYMNETADNVHSSKAKNNTSRLDDNEYSEGLKMNRILKSTECETNFEKDNSVDTAGNLDDYIDIVNEDVCMFVPCDSESQRTSKPKLSTSSSKMTTPEHSQEVFEISDEELNYSMHKSKIFMNDSQQDGEFTHENDPGNFDFGGISLLDDISRAQDNVPHTTLNISKVGLHRSVSDSALTSIEIKGTGVKMKCPTNMNTPFSDSKAKNPTKDKTAFDSIKTPNNTEYLIKTNNVTPMMDFASMTTPDRNKELEKYGVKPFKRKRGK